MSDAALTIWISCGSLLVSAGSLVVSVAAYRRADTLRRFDRLSELRKDIGDLPPHLDQLERTKPEAVQSGASASAALGRGLGGGLQAPIPKRVNNAGIEKTKLVTARDISTRLEQLVQYMRDRPGRPR
jgi:hypothetical protein